MIAFGLTDHVEGPRGKPSRDVYDAVGEYVRLADDLGFDYAWFSEHHAHTHEGHLPAPLLLAVHLAGRTRRIQLGTGIVCLNLHHPLAVAEHVAVADLLSGGRLAPGFGSGSTPLEFALFGLPETQEAERHARFAEALRVVRAAWRGDVNFSGEPPAGARAGPPPGAPEDARIIPASNPGGATAGRGGESSGAAPPDAGGALRYFHVPPHAPLPRAAPDLAARSWVAVNSGGAARVAGAAGFNMLFSHLRTPGDYRDYCRAYRDAGGRGKVAANRPVYVGRDDAAAAAEIEPALRLLWRRFRHEGKIPACTPEPDAVADLAAHPINFVVGGPASVARQLHRLHAEAPFDVANLEVRWAGLPEERVLACVRRLAEDVRPELERLVRG